jgi:dTDP-4-dehydrorhamnose reductase
VRVSWVFGPDRPSFIDWILNKAMETENVEAIGDKWSTPSYTVDLAAMLRPFLREINCGGLLHASNAGACTWREYGEYALECAVRAGAPVMTTKVKGIALADMKAFVAKRPVYTVLATGKLEGLTGMKPREWPKAVEEYVRGKFS